MTAYYNEIDPNAAEWLRQLIKLGAIAPGDVDERDIRDVTPNELTAYTQCHFFAGIGVWSHALRQAGWDDDRPVWTGSCPCQPFSTAGKRKGADDDRDLWWAMFWLIQQCRPETVFGEQVASKDGLAWWDVVQSDLEGANYATTAIDLCAAGIGAPHIRQRLFWVADATGKRSRSRSEGSRGSDKRVQSRQFPKPLNNCYSDCCTLADSECAKRGAQFSDDEHNGTNAGRHEATSRAGACSQVGGVGILADSRCSQTQQQWPERSPQPCSDGQDNGIPSRSGEGLCGTVENTNSRDSQSEQGKRAGSVQEDGARAFSRADGSGDFSDGFWSDAIWLPCADGKARPAKSGAFPLVDGIATDLVCSGDSGSSPYQGIQTEDTSEARTMRLKGYGNAIVGPLAAEFIAAYMESLS